MDQYKLYSDYVVYIIIILWIGYTIPLMSY